MSMITIYCIVIDYDIRVMYNIYNVSRPTLLYIIIIIIIIIYFSRRFINKPLTRHCRCRYVNLILSHLYEEGCCTGVNNEPVSG